MHVCVSAIMTKIMKHRKSVENAVDIEMQGDMLVILSTLCENDVHRKVRRTLTCTPPTCIYTDILVILSTLFENDVLSIFVPPFSS